MTCRVLAQMIVATDLSVGMQLSGDEASNGLVLPAVAIVYFGKAGAVLVVIMCFMAVTSSGAGEILAAASLFTFDIYRKYIRPKVSPDVACLEHCNICHACYLAFDCCCKCICPNVRELTVSRKNMRT